MTETFDTEAILKDILEVLRKHGIPVQTVALDVSIFDADFDMNIPTLKTSKASIFHRPMTVENIPMLFQAKRRIPFEQIIHELEQRIAPQTQQFADDIQREFPNYKIKFHTHHSTGDKNSINKD
jgi:hypothetical protein